VQSRKIKVCWQKSGRHRATIREKHRGGGTGRGGRESKNLATLTNIWTVGARSREMGNSKDILPCFEHIYSYDLSRGKEKSQGGELVRLFQADKDTLRLLELNATEIQHLSANESGGSLLI